MMTEKEYVVEQFDNNFRNIKNSKIAVYGVGANCKAILETYKDYNIMALIDTKDIGTYKFGKLVISIDQAIDLGIENIIMAVQISAIPIVYSRISAFCMSHNIVLYDMYGKKEHKIQGELLRQQLYYFKQNAKLLQKEIDNHEIISFDIMDTLLMHNVWSDEDIYNEMENKLDSLGIHVEEFSNKRKKIDETNVGKLQELSHIYQILQSNPPISSEDRERLLKLEIETKGKALVPRQKMVELFQYSVNNNKKVYLISDLKIPNYELGKILEANNITGYISIISVNECRLSKTTGLYRKLKAEAVGESYLHIGNNLIEDGFAPYMYGIDSYLIKSSKEMLQQVSKFKISEEHLITPYNRKMVTSFMVETYNNPFIFYGTDGMVDVKSELSNAMASIFMSKQYQEEPITYTPKIFMVQPNLAREDKKDLLFFKKYKTPKISIIIPVYNQFFYTYNCLKAILEHSGEVEYEVILADDCSTDLVKDIDKFVDGITILHNKENLKFLKNCNHAAEKAKGQYLLFLNNDTQVQMGWLQPLIDIMESKNDIGMVGSKLIYPNGELQEAGGILWKDGSAWNYGNRKNPEDADYNYVKEVDYISGASIMIKTALWKKIGGFDLRFAPAYCEDSDLAFEVRRLGYKVIYQPLSEVVHFEGISNGNDINCGLKLYQGKNSKKFFDKWKHVLEKEHFQNGIFTFYAKDRSKRKKTILVVDDHVPFYDKDAGGRTTFMYLEMFVRKGYKVLFLGDNFYKHEPYTTVLNQMGVEVLYGSYYYNNWEKWIIENGIYLDYVYFNRPHITIKYLDIIKNYTKAKLLYYVVDLHYLREYRQYKLIGNHELLESSNKWKKLEFEIISKVDVVHVISLYEQEILLKEFPDKLIRNIPVFIYKKSISDVQKDFRLRQDLIFVGGFGHLPNKDAVLWFANNVYPLILQKYPYMKWHIVGSNVPEEIQKLESDNIIIEGFLSDEELHKLYGECRIAVVPLRYGAGVKGKVVEAAYYQIPLITTSIGAEGLDISDGSMKVCDEAGTFAEMVCKLYEDYRELELMSDNGKRFTEKFFTLEEAERVLGLDVEFGKEKLNDNFTNTF